jgi:hypothetical protein
LKRLVQYVMKALAAGWQPGLLLKILTVHALIITWSVIQQVVGVPVAIHTIPGIRTGSIVGDQQLGCILGTLKWNTACFTAS